MCVDVCVCVGKCVCRGGSEIYVNSHVEASKANCSNFCRYTCTYTCTSSGK